jgi:hypothetical protein
MSIADELMKLQQLHESGVLSDEEFAKAKDAVLSGSPGAKPAGGEDEGLLGNLLRGKKETLGHAANRYVNFQMVMAVIGIILMLLFLFVIFLPRWDGFP